MTAFLEMMPPRGTGAGEAIRAAVVAAAFLFVFLTAETWKRRLNPPVEWTRKLVHFASGLICLSFPWLFGSHWTVLALAAAFAAIMRGSRRFGLMTSVHGIERSSKGELYYPIAVYALFVIARHQPVFYAISLFALVVADALAAVLGKTYGRWTYPVESDRKSWEGSAVFFLTTFLGVHLPLLLLTDLDRAHCVLIGLQVALLVTSFEAISLRGNDNLIVPLATYYLLLKMTPKTAESVGLQLAVQLAILAAVGVIAWRTRFLTASGAIAAHLVIYAAFSLGGPPWSLAPTLALAGFMALDPTAARPDRDPERGYQVLAVFYVSLVAVLLIFADNIHATLIAAGPALQTGHPFYVPFVGALAAQFAIIAFLFLKSFRRFRHQPRPALALAAAAIAFSSIVPLSLWAGTGAIAPRGIMVAAAVCGGGIMLYLLGHRTRRWPKGALWDLRLQTASVAVATLVVLPLHLGWFGSRAAP